MPIPAVWSLGEPELSNDAGGDAARNREEELIVRGHGHIEAPDESSPFTYLSLSLSLSSKILLMDKILHHFAHTFLAALVLPC